MVSMTRAVTPNALAGNPARANRSFALLMKNRVRFAPRHRAALLAVGVSFVSGAFAQTSSTASAASSNAEPTQSLAPVTVTATRFVDSAETLPMGVSVITAEDIRNSGAVTVNEALTRLLGIVARDDMRGGGEAAPDLRGFGATADSNQVIVVDGQRLSEADTGTARISHIPVDAIERVEVIRGSGAVLYGEGATGGVILITTKAGAGKARRSGATAYVGVGSNRLRDERATATLVQGGVSLDAHATHRTSDGWRDNSRSRASSQGLGVQWAGDWLRVGANLAQDDLTMRLPGPVTPAEFAQNPRKANENNPGSLANNRQTVFAQAELGAWQLAFDAGHRTRESRVTYPTYFFNYDIVADTQALRARHQSSVRGMTNTLVLGLDQGQWKRDVNTNSGRPRATQESRAWYLRDDVVLAGGTRISAGWRTEQIEKKDQWATSDLNGRQNAWELGLSQPLSDGWVAYGRIGTSYRLPKVDEFSGAASGVTLVPQTSRDVELGARWKHAQGSLDMRFFDNRLEHEIAYLSAPYWYNTNLDPTHRQGLEADLVQKLSAAVGLRFNAGLRNASVRSGTYAGKDIAYAPKSNFAARMDWTPAANHRVSGGVNWVASQYVDFANSCSIPAYAVADLRYTYQWGKAELIAGIGNLFDRHYYSQGTDCSSGSPSAVYPEAGRTFTLAVRAGF